MSSRKHFISGMAGVLVGALLVAATPAIATVGQAIVYGVLNTGDALTTIQGSVNGELVKIRNTGAGDNALELVADGPNLVISNGKKIRMLNADRVDSLSANQLIRSEHTATLNAAEGNGVKLTLTIDAPFNGDLILGGNLSASAGDTTDTYVCSIEVDLAPVDGTLVSAETASAGTNLEEDCSTTAGVRVAAGSHTVTLNAANVDSATSVLFYAASLWAIYVPFDGDGTKIHSIP
jgi:hypothetical protein